MALILFRLGVSGFWLVSAAAAVGFFTADLPSTFESMPQIEVRVQ
jgi:hypothetical protein